MKNKLPVLIIAIIVAGGAGFYGGVQYQKIQTGKITELIMPNGTGATNKQNSDGKQAGGGGRPINGEITSADTNTLTVKSQDGSSKIVTLSASTKINKTSEGSKSDLEVGDSVIITGSENSDGSVTAQTISLGAALSGGMPGNGNLPTQGAVD
jgi:hypothetical protein